jgi:hypothetical protein
MHDTVFAGLLGTAFLLAAALSQTLFHWTGKLRPATGPRIPDIDAGILRRVHFAHDASPGTGQTPGAGAGPASPRGTLAVAGDWLVPAIVWILVILMGAAVVGFLLGNQ